MSVNCRCCQKEYGPRMRVITPAQKIILSPMTIMAVSARSTDVVARPPAAISMGVCPEKIYKFIGS